MCSQVGKGSSALLAPWGVAGALVPARSEGHVHSQHPGGARGGVAVVAAHGSGVLGTLAGFWGRTRLRGRPRTQGAWPAGASVPASPAGPAHLPVALPSPALDLHTRKERFPAQHQRLSLGCPVLDGLLCGGLPLDGITELAGCSSAGKTQLALQLCLVVQFPRQHGGLEAGE